MAFLIPENILYSSYFVEQYLNSLPWYRKILATFFERYRVTKKEYDEWFWKKKYFLTPS